MPPQQTIHCELWDFTELCSRQCLATFPGWRPGNEARWCPLNRGASLPLSGGTSSPDKPRTSCVTVPSYRTVNLVKEPATHQLVTHRFRGRRKQPRTHFQNLNDNFITVCNVYCFKHLAVLSPAQFPHDLVVVLIPVTRDKRGKCHLLASYSCTDSPPTQN